MTDIDRFMNKVIKQPTGCWEWQSAKDADGYGMFWNNKKTSGAHRWIYQYTNNVLLSVGECVCHTCDNPSCVNPQHMFIDTNVGNTADRHQKGRSVKGSAVGTSKLTEADVRHIRYNLSHLTLKQVADLYNVSITPIHYIRIGKTWKHV